MVNATERLTIHDYALCIRVGSEQAAEQPGVQVREIAGNDQVPVGIGGGQRSLDSAQRSVARIQIGNSRIAKLPVDGGTSQEVDRASYLGDNGAHIFRKRLTSKGEQRLVAAHSFALAAHQHPTGGCSHERIIALTSFGKSGIRLTGFLGSFCILAATALAAGSAPSGDTEPVRPVVQRVISTVKADPRSGRLVRSTVVVAPRVIQPKVVTSTDLGSSGVPPSALGPNASINEMVDDAAGRHGVDPLLVHSVIKVESNYNPRAVSRVGAQGLMQLMPATARSLGVQNSFDPKDNIEGGVKYLKKLQGMFSDPALALAAYNAGEGAVQRFGTIPPYAETQDYVVKVARNYRQARATRPTKATPQPQAQAQPEPPPAPKPPKIEYSYDAQGRLSIRTVQQ